VAKLRPCKVRNGGQGDRAPEHDARVAHSAALFGPSAKVSMPLPSKARTWTTGAPTRTAALASDTQAPPRPSTVECRFVLMSTYYGAASQLRSRGTRGPAELCLEMWPQWMVRPERRTSG
jgi:hypothetical protein